LVAATAELVETHSAHESSWLWWSYLLGGASYPLWWLLGPRGEYDPWWPWWIVGACYVAAGATALSRVRRPPRLCFLPSFATAVHLHVLFALHPWVPFYALAPALNAFSSLLMFQDAAVMRAFTATVLVLSLLPLVLGDGLNVLFYASGAASFLYLANRRLRSRALTAEAQPELLDALRDANLRYEQAHSDRQRLQQELEVAQRMESVGQLAGRFAHEFNNQLMAIHLYSEMLGQALPPDSPLHKDLRGVSQATNEAAALSARLLAYSSGPRLQEDRSDLAQVLRASRVVLENVMSRDTKVVVRLPSEPCPVAVSPERVEQVLLNLALNARDAMPDGGMFQVGLRRRRGSELDLPDWLDGFDVAELVVSDTGVGIAPEAHSRVFQPFYTTKDESAHSGLGLSVVYGIVSDSGGVVRLRSAPGQGARFEIYWPLHDARRVHSSQSPPCAIEGSFEGAGQASISPARIA
jgi:signal transduction histidine kinase